ncbi:hypothetical protein Tco_0639634, partial [Tanacetum coccineum]
KKESIWLKWVTNNRLKGSSIWEVDCDKNASSGWKSILGLRDKIRNHVICKVGDEASIFIWNDKWWGPEPITKLISMDDVIQEGLDPNSKLNDMINRGKWRWPVTVQNNNVLKNILVPKLTEGVKDEFLWINKDGKSMSYSTNKTWKDWRNNGDKKHNKSIRSVLIKVIIAACVYFIWTERNKRHFTNEKQSCKDLVDNVVYHVRLKLASLTVKWTEQVEDISRKWKIIFNVRNEDGILLDTMDLQ